MSGRNRNVLAVGVYLSDVTNLASEITSELLDTRLHDIEIRWASIGSTPTSNHLLNGFTHCQFPHRISKTVAINLLLSACDLSCVDFIIVVDDDIALPVGFLDGFLAIAEHRQFALCQPARTHTSFIDHYFVAQLMGIESRSTNFVEIGPLFCLHKSAFSVLIPLDESAPMGWGLDFVWPVLLADRGLRMGIIDAYPVEHALRKPVSLYSYEATQQAMHAFLCSGKHLSLDELFHIQDSYSFDS